MYTLPFKLTEVYGGFAEAEGLLRYENETLWIELQTKDAFFGVLQSGVKKVTLRAADLDAVQLKHRPFRSYLTLCARTMEALISIPGTTGAELKLVFLRKHREGVANLHSSLALAISEARLARLDSHDDWPDRLPSDRSF